MNKFGFLGSNCLPNSVVCNGIVLFFKINNDSVVLTTTELLSPNIVHGPSNYTLSILSMYLYLMAISAAK